MLASKLAPSQGVRPDQQGPRPGLCPPWPSGSQCSDVRLHLSWKLAVLAHWTARLASSGELALHSALPQASFCLLSLNKTLLPPFHLPLFCPRYPGWRREKWTYGVSGRAERCHGAQAGTRGIVGTPCAEYTENGKKRLGGPRRERCLRKSPGGQRMWRGCAFNWKYVCKSCPPHPQQQD